MSVRRGAGAVSASRRRLVPDPRDRPRPGGAGLFHRTRSASAGSCARRKRTSRARSPRPRSHCTRSPGPRSSPASSSVQSRSDSACAPPSPSAVGPPRPPRAPDLAAAWRSLALVSPFRQRLGAIAPAASGRAAHDLPRLFRHPPARSADAGGRTARVGLATKQLAYAAGLLALLWRRASSSSSIR